MSRTSSHPGTNAAPPRRVLIRGVNWLGDAVMTTPAIQRLREKFSAAHLALLTPAKLAELWQGHPALNEILVFRREDGLVRVARQLAAGNFDTALVLPNSPRSALEVWLARIPRRLGCARPWRNWFLSDVVPPRSGEVRMRKRSVAEIRALIQSPYPAAATAPASNSHQTYEYLHLAAALGADPAPVAPALFVPDAELASATARFGLPGPAKPVAGLNPGAEYGPAKRWPAERFAAAAIELRRRTGCAWLVFGGPNDRPAAAEIAAAIQATTGPESVLDLAGRTSLRELMALLKRCRLLLTNDTGPMHVAAALGTPVVVPFGSTAPELTGPGLPGDSRHRLLKASVPCSPCYLRRCPIDLRCLNQITVEEVVRAASPLLAPARG